MTTLLKAPASDSPPSILHFAFLRSYRYAKQPSSKNSACTLTGKFVSRQSRTSRHVATSVLEAVAANQTML